MYLCVIKDHALEADGEWSIAPQIPTAVLGAGVTFTPRRLYIRENWHGIR